MDPAASQTLVSKSAYARMRGCAPSAITKALNEGRISAVGGKIDPAKADADWQRNTRARGDSRSAADVARQRQSGESAALSPGRNADLSTTAPPNSAPPAPAPPSAPAAAPAAAEPPSPVDPNAPPPYADSRARREHTAAQREAMLLAQDAGKLVERAAVDRAVFDAFRVLRDRCMQAARRAAPLVIGLADVADVERVFEDELRAALAPDPATFAAAMPWQQREG